MCIVHQHTYYTHLYYNRSIFFFSTRISVFFSSDPNIMLNIRTVIRRRRRPSGTNLVPIVIIILNRVLNRCLVLVYSIIMIYCIAEVSIHCDDYMDCGNGVIRLRNEGVVPSKYVWFFLQVMSVVRIVLWF